MLSSRDNKYYQLDQKFLSDLDHAQKIYIGWQVSKGSMPVYCQCYYVRYQPMVPYSAWSNIRNHGYEMFYFESKVQTYSLFIFINNNYIKYRHLCGLILIFKELLIIIYSLFKLCNCISDPMIYALKSAYFELLFLLTVTVPTESNHQTGQKL